MTRIIVPGLVLALLSGCTGSGTEDRPPRHAVAVELSPPPAVPIAGVCPECEGSLRKVPILAGQPIEAIEELFRAGESLLASRLGTGAEVDEVLICDACRTWRLSLGQPPVDTGTILARTSVPAGRGTGTPRRLSVAPCSASAWRLSVPIPE